MKRLIFILSLTLIGLTGLHSQVYPLWDDGPEADQAAGGIGHGPFVATANPPALFGEGYDGSNNRIARWTPCGGWENLLGLYGGGGGAGFLGKRYMTIHGHYLYAVGAFSFTGNPPFNVNIVKFDFNTGVWCALGQNFTAVNIDIPTTIAIDDSNRIYVGFELEHQPNGSFAGQTVDMLDVSTNEGATWQEVGAGLVACTEGDTVHPGISALCASGTNVYIAGDFYQAAGCSVTSPHIIMWNANAWLPFTNSVVDGVAINGVAEGRDWDPEFVNQGLNTASGLDTVEDIACIGTNVYVTGDFDWPEVGIARFSNVTGGSLLLANTPFTLDFLSTGIGCWTNDYFGNNLAVNNGNLYLSIVGNGLEINNGLDSVSCLTDPTDPYPQGWVSLAGGLTLSGGGITGPGMIDFLAAATNGNAVYVQGAYDNNYSLPFNVYDYPVSRWMVAPDGPIPTVSSVSVGGQSGSFVLTITGTPGSHWQVMSSLDQNHWNNVGSVTLWGGAATFNDLNGYPPSPVYYMLSDKCGNSAIYSDAIITTVAGNFNLGSGYSGDGYAATSAQLNYPDDVKVDGSGNLFIADTDNNVIRKVDANGIISTVLGGGSVINAEFPTEVSLSYPTAIAVGSPWGYETLFVADTYNNLIRNDLLGGSGYTFIDAGYGFWGYSPDGNYQDANFIKMANPGGVATYGGYIYYADTYNHIVRKTDGNNLTTVAGNYILGQELCGGYGGDGEPATGPDACLNFPTGIAFDALGNLYIADSQNNLIRKVDTAGIISTFAGNSTFDKGYDGDNGPAIGACMNHPQSVCVDASGNIYIADTCNHVIRKVDSVTGIITTVAGNNNLGGTYQGDGGDPLNAGLSFPNAVSVDSAGNIYIADTYNNVIRKVTYNH